MKTIALMLAAAGALFLSSCAACHKCASCCSGAEAATKPCCKEAAAKGMKCEKCAAMKAGTTTPAAAGHVHKKAS